MPADLISRHLFEDVRAALDRHRIVSLVGARQVGKSTLVRQLRDDDPGRFDVIDLDVADARRELKDDPGSYLHRPGRTVIIDEAQRAPELMLPLKSAVDDDPRPGRFLITGSADLWAVQDPGIRDSLAGRTYRTRLWGLSQSEIEGTSAGAVDALFAGREPAGHESALDRGDYLRRAVAGGFPGLVGTTQGPRREWLTSYAESRTREDATDFGSRRRHLSELPQLLRLLAARSAQELNIAALAREFPVSEKSVPAYVDLLAQLYLVDRIPPWSRNLGKRVTNKPKVVVSDAGLMAALLGLRTVGGRGLNREDMVGALIETFVAGEILRLASVATTPVEVSHQRGHDGVEVDLVLEADDGHVVAVETKAAMRSGGADAGGLRHLRKKLGKDFVIGLVLHSGPRVERLEDRILSCPIDLLWRWPPSRVATSKTVSETRPTSRDRPRNRGSVLSSGVKEIAMSDMRSVPGPKLFIGYTRDDEEATGAITTIEQGLRRAYRVVSVPAQELSIFVDTSSLRWGDDWQREIDAALEDSAFYVPVLTPRFFDSPPCRDEAEKFLARVERDHVRRKRLVLPVLLIDVPDLRRGSPDLLKAKLSTYQHIDLLAHVVSSPDDPGLRALLWSMADDLKRRVEAFDAGPDTRESTLVQDDDDLDVAELMVGMSDLEEGSQELIGSLDQVMGAMGDYATELGSATGLRIAPAAAERAKRTMEEPLSQAEELLATLTSTLRMLDQFVGEAPTFLAAGVVDEAQLLDLAAGFDQVAPPAGEMEQMRQMLKVVGLTSRAMRRPVGRFSTVIDGLFAMMAQTSRWAEQLRDTANSDR